jgi:hypothetical protein
MDVPTFTLIAQYGAPLVFLVGIALSARQAAIWLGSNVVKPMAEKHIEFLESTTGTMKQQAEAAQTTARTLEALQEQQQINSEHIAEIRSNTSRLACLVNNRPG